MTTKTVEPKIKILRVIARLNIGGPAIHTILLSRHMESLGYETILVTGQVGPEEGDMRYLAEVEGVKPITISRLGRRLLPFSDLMAFVRILRLLFSWRPQIVHTHTAKAGAVGRMAAAVYNKVQGVRQRAQGLIRRMLSGGGTKERKRSGTQDRCIVVHTFHGHVLQGYFSSFKSKYFKLIERILAKFTDAIVVVGEQQKDELSTKFGIGRPEQYRVILLGFNLNLFAQGPSGKGKLRAHLGFAKNSYSLVGIVGRLTPIKNHRFFLEAVHLVATKKGNTRARFLVVGDGELRGDLEELTEKLSLTNRVVFTGWLRDLESLYADLDVLALTSNNEGTPVAVIEAMAAGLPVIATDVGGVRELISERGKHTAELGRGKFEICERGVLVRRGEIEGFAEGLQYLLDRPEVRTEMGLRGRQYATQRHSAERLVSDMDKLYQSLLGRNDK
jgi:glycosyltransferase involved in cell wall biosynthesis